MQPATFALVKGGGHKKGDVLGIARVAAKGSITVDGVSLTVNAVADQADGACHFTLNIIPHTAEVTTVGALKAGDGVNLEIDVLARYLMRMQALKG